MTSFARLRSTTTAGVAVLALGLAACGGDGDGAASADSCDALAEDAKDLIQDLVDEVDGMSLADLAAAGDEEPEFMTEFEEEGEALSERQEELGCSDEEMSELLAARVDEIETEPGSIGAMMVEAIKTDGLDFEG